MITVDRSRFVEGQPALARGYPVTLVVGNVPVAPPLRPMGPAG